MNQDTEEFASTHGLSAGDLKRAKESYLKARRNVRERREIFLKEVRGSAPDRPVQYLQSRHDEINWQLEFFDAVVVRMLSRISAIESRVGIERNSPAASGNSANEDGAE